MLTSGAVSCGPVDQDLLAAVATSVAAQAQAAAKAAAGPAGMGGAGLGKGLPPQPNTLPTVALELTREELEEVVEFDDWLLDFAELFREHLGIDADGHVDLHNEGLEKCNAALEEAVSFHFNCSPESVQSAPACGGSRWKKEEPLPHARDGLFSKTDVMILRLLLPHER